MSPSIFDERDGIPVVLLDRAPAAAAVVPDLTLTQCDVLVEAGLRGTFVHGRASTLRVLVTAGLVEQRLGHGRNAGELTVLGREVRALLRRRAGFGPERVQVRRTKGSRLIATARYCGRPTKFGNPYRGPDAAERFDRELRACHAAPFGASHTIAIRNIVDDLFELRHLDLACWCALDAPCHVDTYLDLANRRRRRNAA